MRAKIVLIQIFAIITLFSIEILSTILSKSTTLTGFAALISVSIFILTFAIWTGILDEMISSLLIKVSPIQTLKRSSLFKLFFDETESEDSAAELLGSTPDLIRLPRKNLGILVWFSSVLLVSCILGYSQQNTNEDPSTATAHKNQGKQSKPSTQVPANNTGSAANALTAQNQQKQEIKKPNITTTAVNSPVNIVIADKKFTKKTISVTVKITNNTDNTIRLNKKLLTANQTQSTGIQEIRPTKIKCYGTIKPGKSAKCSATWKYDSSLDSIRVNFSVNDTDKEFDINIP